MSSGDRVRLAIFASGAGSNALKIIEHFAANPDISVTAIICNNPNAGVIAHAREHQIPTLLITRKLLNDQEWFLTQLNGFGIDYIVLAGFLLLIPEYLVDAFPEKIINIHPALLPKYGGKGMYGMRVHEAVQASGDTESGITIHLVNTHYDEGRIVFQKSVSLAPSDTPDQIAEKIHLLEHAWYPKVIEEWVDGK